MEIVSKIVSFVFSILSLLYNVLVFLFDSFINGFQFFVSTFTNIPNLVFELLNELPPFFQVGLTGIFGLLLVVVFFKLYQIIKVF